MIIRIAHMTASVIETISIAIIVWGVIMACYRILQLGIDNYRGEIDLRGGWMRVRRAFGEVMLLALQFLVAADIILTICYPDLMTIAVLAAVVVIRVVLSVSLGKEINEMEINSFEDKHHLSHV